MKTDMGGAKRPARWFRKDRKHWQDFREDCQHRAQEPAGTNPVEVVRTKHHAVLANYAVMRNDEARAMRPIEIRRIVMENLIVVELVE